MTTRTLTVDEFVGTCPFRLRTVIELCAAQCHRARCSGKDVISTPQGDVDTRTGEILEPVPSVCGRSVHGRGDTCGYMLSASRCCPRHGRLQ